MATNETTCLLCGETAILKHKAFPGYQEPQTFKIYHCQACDTSFALPRLADTQALYDLIYHNGDSVPGYSRYWEYARQIKESTAPLDFLAKNEEVYWGVREALAHTSEERNRLNILEVGSGLGYLTFALRRAGFNAVGLDISEAAVERAKETYGDFYVSGDLLQFAESNLGKYDFVIFTEVIEHINSPLPFVEATFKMLKTGGKAIITTPNKSLFPADILWESDLPPVHSWWFSESSINYIANKMRAKVSFVDFGKFYSGCEVIKMDKVRKNPLPEHVFDAKGGLRIFPAAKRKKKHLAGTTFLRKISYHLRHMLKEDIVMLKQTGTTICAILEKTDRP